MKKALLLVSVLFISVVSTACINKFAVQELNNKAKGYIEQGDYTNAIERLKSSVDLDNNVFETHYNLAVAYTQAEDYVNAINSFKKAINALDTTEVEITLKDFMTLTENIGLEIEDQGNNEYRIQLNMGAIYYADGKMYYAVG